MAKKIVRIELETAKAALLNLEVLRDLVAVHPEYPYKKNIDKYIADLKQAVGIETNG